MPSGIDPDTPAKDEVLKYIFWTLTTGTLWNTTFKILFIAAQAYVIYLMLNDYKPTHDPNIDTFKVQYLLGGSAVLAILLPYRYEFAEILWAFSIWLESVAILPQLFMLQRTGEAETITTHYLFALGLYRALYIPNWLYRYFAEGIVFRLLLYLLYKSAAGQEVQPAGLGVRSLGVALEAYNIVTLALQLLQPRLSTLLASPLPQDILSPRIKLHLFPSTHPHLPTVSGRVAYHAALWSAPVAWGRVPIVGNVKLIITSERMVKCGPSMHSPSGQQERLIVRWRTCLRSDTAADAASAKDTKAVYRGIGPREQVNKFTEWLSNPTSTSKREDAFAGLFIFEFDEEGRIVTHTIEHAEESGGAERASRVVNLTDWLIGRARNRREKVPEFAWAMDVDKRRIQSKR
ncbi:MAG: hypothetical protein Q9174_001043 [Haloplaca sp. 1 TL-2023]